MGDAPSSTFRIDPGSLARSGLLREVGEATLRDDINVRQALESAQRLAAIVESSDDAILTKALDGIITSWNRGAERLFGYSAAEAIGRPITILIPHERHDEEREILGRIRRGEERQKLLVKEFQHRIKNTLATVQSIATQTFRRPCKKNQLGQARLDFEPGGLVCSIEIFL